MKKILCILSAVLLLAGCGKDDTATRLAEVYNNGAEQIKDASDMGTFKKVTADVVAEREKLKKEVSAADFEKAAKEGKVSAAEQRYAAVCLEKVSVFGVGALKNILSTSDADLTKLIDDAADIIQDNTGNVDDFSEEFDKALNDAAEDFKRALEEAKNNEEDDAKTTN